MVRKKLLLVFLFMVYAMMLSSKISLEGVRKPKKSSAGIVSLHAEILTQDLMYAKQENYPLDHDIYKMILPAWFLSLYTSLSLTT
jgi:hypothetical protein